MGYVVRLLKLLILIKFYLMTVFVKGVFSSDFHKLFCIGFSDCSNHIAAVAAF